MVAGFAQTPRAQHERRARPAVERVIREAFASQALTVSLINWTDASTDLGLAMERMFGIDGAIYFADGQRLTFQAKALQAHYASFGTITVEHYNNPLTGKKGDWFNCIAEVYVCGYVSGDYRTMQPWAVVNYPALKVASLQGRVRWSGNDNHKTSALASFKHTRIADLPPDVVIARQVTPHL